MFIGSSFWYVTCIVSFSFPPSAVVVTVVFGTRLSVISSTAIETMDAKEPRSVNATRMVGPSSEGTSDYGKLSWNVGTEVFLT